MMTKLQNRFILCNGPKENKAAIRIGNLAILIVPNLALRESTSPRYIKKISFASAQEDKSEKKDTPG